MDNKKFYNVNELLKSKKYPFSEGTLRHLLHNRENNGLSAAIGKIGKRLIIDMEKFDSWVGSYIGNE